MDKSRLEIKVGLFVFIGLVLLAVLLIQFSKGTSLFRGTYELRLHAVNVGGLKERAGVLLAGVQVGSVSDIQLADDGKSVTILLKIYKDYQNLPRRAVRHRAIRLSRRPVCFRHPHDQPAAGSGPTTPTLTARRRSTCRKSRAPPPASSSALMKPPKNWTPSVTDLRRVVLNEQTLTNFSVAVDNLRTFSEQAIGTVDDINALVATNGAQVGLAVSNVVFFSQELIHLADSARGVVWRPMARKFPPP